MIMNYFFMNGYEAYVLSAFGFTLLSFVSLYFVTKTQFVREQKKFIAKFGSLETEKAELAKSQRINKEILADATNS